MEDQDHYKVLQLHPDADHAMVVQAYWHLARKYKTAMERDAFAERAVEELNRSFEVLGSPELRAAYDRQRAATYDPEPETKRVSIEICFWHLPAWQGMLAAGATIALAAVAITSGAPLLPALSLAALATLAALLVLPGLDYHNLSPRRRWRRSIRAADLQKSTSRAVERWRRANTRPDATPLADFSDPIDMHVPFRGHTPSR